MIASPFSRKPKSTAYKDLCIQTNDRFTARDSEGSSPTGGCLSFVLKGISICILTQITQISGHSLIARWGLDVPENGGLLFLAPNGPDKTLQ